MEHLSELQVIKTSNERARDRSITEARSVYNSNKHIGKAQNLIHRNCSKRIHITHAQTEATAHTNILTIQLNLHSLKRAANGDLRWMKTAARNRKHGRSTNLGKEVFLCCIWMSPERDSHSRHGYIDVPGTAGIFLFATSFSVAFWSAYIDTCLISASLLTPKGHHHWHSGLASYHGQADLPKTSPVHKALFKTSCIHNFSSRPKITSYSRFYSVLFYLYTFTFIMLNCLIVHFFFFFLCV